MAVEIKEWLTGCLVHQDAGQRVFLTALQSGIAYSIYNDDIIRALSILCALARISCSADFERGVMELHFGYAAV